eukprot:1774063-Prorocentrum_lima.AAC.1
MMPNTGGRNGPTLRLASTAKSGSPCQPAFSSGHPRTCGKHSPLHRGSMGWLGHQVSHGIGGASSG